MKFEKTPIALAALTLLASAPFAQAAPTVSFKTPLAGATISGSISQNSACEVTGSNIRRVVFSVASSSGATTALNTELSAPWNCNIDTRKFADGSYTLKAVAYDGANVSASATRSVTIRNGTTANTPPTVSLNSLGTVSGASVACGAAASDSNGVKQVQFFLDGSTTAFATDTTSPYNCSFDSTRLANGSHTIKAVATDNLGATSSAQTAFTVSNTTADPTLPSLRFTSPAPGGALKGVVQGPPNCTVTGTNIARIMFYLNDVWINTDGNASNGWGCWVDTTKYKDGAYTVKAVAYNAAGKTTTVTHPITIQNGSTTTNTPPSVNITKPDAGATLIAPTACEATASDNGSVAGVQFKLVSSSGAQTVLGTDNAAPYACTIDTANLANGAYTLIATATDNQGASSTTQRSLSIYKSGSSGIGGGSGVDPADILARATADTDFAQQSNYYVQVIGTAPYVTAIPESGVNGTVLPNGEKLRFGKVVDPDDTVKKALSVQVHRDDPNTSGAKRTEIRAPDNIEFNKVYWVAVGVYVYDWGTLSTSDQALFGMQVHSGNNNLGLSPSLALVTQNGGTGRNFQVFTLHSTSSSPSPSNSVSARYGTQPIPFGRWVDFVFKFRHNTSGNGFAQVWMDGNLIADHKGNLGFNTPGYNDYLKFGYYNWSGSSMSATARKVLLRSPTVVADPTGSKYNVEQLRAMVSPAAGSTTVAGGTSTTSGGSSGGSSGVCSTLVCAVTQ